MALPTAILRATCLPHPAGVLRGINPDCPAASAPIPTTAALARTRSILCHVHGLLSGHLQAAQRAVLDAGNRVAVLHAFALAGAGYAPGSMAGQAELSSARNDLTSSGIDCLGSLLTLLRHLLYATSLGNSPCPPSRLECHPVLYLRD